MGMLTLESVNVFYGAIHALRDVSLTVNAGEVVTLIGANGAGKSTTLRAVSGLLAPSSGSILFEGESIAGVPAHRLVARGISMAPEGRGIFANLTVLENLEMGAYLSKDKAQIRQGIERGFTLFPRLKERATSATAVEPAICAVFLNKRKASLPAFMRAGCSIYFRWSSLAFANLLRVPRVILELMVGIWSRFRFYVPIDMVVCHV